MFYLLTWCLVALSLTNANCKKVKSVSDINFHFTKPLYNVSIPENSMANTYASPSPGERVGIQIHKKNAFKDIRYKIVNGDKDKFFKAEGRLVGDFSFLFIRIKSGNNHVLNRERKDKYVLEIKAIAYPQSENKHKVAVEAQTIVEITILDTNDLSPLFYPTDYNVTVYEDTPLHRNIVKVTAEDADLGRNGEIYYSFAEETDQFAIHPITGIISLTRPLLYSETSYHELIVIGQDRSAALTSSKYTNSMAMSKATVRIRVSKVNFHPPEINVRSHAKIVENSISDIYAIVTVTDKDTGIHGEIKSLEIVGGDPDGHFRIRPTSQKGEYTIEVLKLLDREKTPAGYTLELRAVDRGIPPKETYKSVRVVLADLNDNAPVFNKEIYEVKVPETAPINTPLIRLKVTDADEGKNARVYLEIVGGNEGGEFFLNSETGMLYTAVNLDAEKKPFYSLTVSAIDQGNVATRKQSSAKVKIYVIDTNDNDPIFENPEMTVWINENQPAGTSVTTVRAKDQDSGENAYISYLMANLAKVPFEIDHFSGVIRTTTLLDYESMRREYVLHLRASDWGLPHRRQTEMQMTIKVKDINDNRPQFERIDCSGHVSRFTPVGTEIITLSAIDFDAGNIISYRIVSGNDDGCFAIDPTSGTVSLACDLNNVPSTEREVNVTATDGTHFADIVRVNIKLVNTKGTFTANNRILPSDTFECKETGVARRLTEILAASENNNKIGAQEEFPMMPTRYGQNIHSPELIDFPTEIRVNESVSLGTVLIKIKATDRDLGYNGELVYGISGGDEDSVFCIDMDTGRLKVIGYLDREREHEYNLNITVYDLGKPQKSTSRVLIVTVLDVNDNPPKFEKSLASFRVTENALNGTVIFKANATDLDVGDNAKITYSLITDTNDFVVNKRTGALKVANDLDRERQEVYDLRIRASDGGGKDPAYPRLYSDAIVRIIVDDINDNAPKFSLPNYVVKIREDVPVGTVLAVVTAFDPDLGDDGRIVYTLKDNVDNIFKIDNVSGTVRTTKHLDYEVQQVHSITVVARDCGNPQLSSETLVTINVVDVNENLFAPHFSDFVFSGSVLENQEPGTVVIQVNATDQDPAGEDSRIEYSIKGGDGIGIFSIDNNGIIRTTSILDIETKSHYWLTVYAQDRGIVPLSSSVEVYIEVLNENDNVPLSEQAVYYPSIPEDSPAGHSIVQISASDNDIDSDQKISFSIISGNPGGFFAINSSTGLITTTSRRLDRENQEEHILEVLISDNGRPVLTSTTRVVVKVEDINDNSPEFEQSFYKVQVSASNDPAANMLQAETIKDEGDNTVVISDGDQWEISFSDDLLGFKPIMRVLAFDKDIGINGQLQYTIKSGKEKNKFRINNSTGIIYSQKALEAGQEYELNVRATDGGSPPRSATAHVSILVVQNENKNSNPPVVKTPSRVEVTENDKVGFLVTLIQATDEDGDILWFDIVGGDPRNEFYIGCDSGNVLLARQLDHEVQNAYTLNISVTDSFTTVYTRLDVTVIDINEHRPEFSKQLYKAEISENVSVGTELLQLQATDKDDDKKLIYGLHSARNAASLKTFKVDSASGRITLASGLDRETISEHYLTVVVRDGGTPAKRNYARVLVVVHDHNDHSPAFSEKILIGRVFESTAIGSAVLRAYAVDKDHGENGRVTYSITGGNVGNAFAIDPESGVIRLTRELDVLTVKEYTLHIRAMDHGNPALSSSIRAYLTVAMADNAPPRCVDAEVAAEVFEDKALGGYVAHLDVKSTSSLQFEIINGNDDMDFAISPSTGVIVTANELDYERNKIYNLTVLASNMASATVKCHVIVHVLDVNDNAPRFLQATYTGSISEAAAIDSLVMTSSSEPLVIKAIDADSETNALLQYDIIEPLPQRYFSIDANTGALKTVRSLDRETFDHFTFHVQVSDLGKPRLSSETTAKVHVVVTDVNDCPPEFSQSIYNATVLLPTYKDVTVVQLNATDRDEDSNILRYDIIDGNDGNFDIDPRTGTITVSDPNNLRPFHRMQVRVSDGKHSSVVRVYVKAVPSESSGLVFQKDIYTGTVIENSTKVSIVCVVNVLGNDLYEHVEFRILNPTEMFEVGLTSGVIRNTGKKFDREIKDHYELIVEAISRVPDSDKPRVAHVMVNVTVLDVNDNSPMFVNLPYYAVVSVDDEKGSVIGKVHAIDMDSFENGEVRYELIKGHGELFKVQRETGDIELKQSLEGHNREYELVVAAYDKGIPPCRTEVKVHIKVVDRSMPVFKKQFYSEVVAENVELHSPLSVLIQAESPLDRKLIYTIVSGNDQEKFALDFSTGLLSVIDELDFETKQQYELIIRATDCISGVHAEVPVSIVIQDVNDCPPEFEQESYNVSISEAAPFGSMVVTVSAKDNDTGINKKVKYSILNDRYNSTNYFHVDEDDGSVYLKQSLDYERKKSHHFVVAATDQGMPSLSSITHVWLTVVDMNDNTPKFEQSSYVAGLSIHARRDQFVTAVKAYDPDSIDQKNLKYGIVSGNQLQTFSIDPRKGIITLINLSNFGDQSNTILNVSVSDGVYTSFAKLKVDLLAANLHSPSFPNASVDAAVPENKPAGHVVTTVKAIDKDFGEFGTITYYIQSQVLEEVFAIDKNSGRITTTKTLDRETQKSYEIPVVASDGGGKLGFLTVNVKVLDANDNPPKFYLKEYKASIDANHSLDISFLKVRAFDLDEDTNAEIEYSIYDKKLAGINDLISINPRTGELFLINNAQKLKGRLFQFFVRAANPEGSSMHNDVPVDILIKEPNESAPIFERKDETFSLPENSAAGTVITRLKMASHVKVNYKIVSNFKDEQLFDVDKNGQLTLIGSLDFESQQSHVIGVVAETDSSPPLTSLTEIFLQVTDENDHSPQFESNPYLVNLAENVEVGSPILKVVANDKDQRTNGEVRYSFSSDSEETLNTFAIDPFSGIITTLVTLDKESVPEYKFHVTAVDNGIPKHSARTTVIVKLKDYNDNPSVFSRRTYESEVFEDALPGTVILTLDLQDVDVDLPLSVEYFITSGDDGSQFSIRNTGELYVVKQLDRETVANYTLDVLVSDGKFTDVTKVYIQVLDVNDNLPYCVHHRYRSTLSEGLLPESFILRVLAYDIDEAENSKLKYILTGDGSEDFALHKEEGLLSTAALLDRERRSKYSLVAHVQDKEHPDWECLSKIEISISDLNDNRPQFSAPYYSVSLPEDAEVGTLVTKIHATDEDVGVNRKINYYLSDSSDDHFKIVPNTGVVILAKSLDRELQAMYNVTIEAVDQGVPQLSSRISMIVNVQDINDNPPEFTRKSYFASVPEIDAVGTEIARVLATSKDAGVNADVYYTIIGGNEHRKFVINNRTGVITIAEMLDYERAKEYLLTVQAIDGGIPPLSNVATVNITVIDCNDNAPVFSQTAYSARIREDALINDKIVQVTATDLDSGENGKITYSIIRGDNHGQFAIDPETGYISVAEHLDRETISNYVIEVLAKDSGSPVLSNQVLVTIEISDANDNAPVFAQPNYTAVVQEDKSIGHPILKFVVTDADSPPNTEPYTFDFLSGNEGNFFRLEQDGILRTATKFNYKIKDTYFLQIRVFDNGTPPLFSDTWVVIKVIEESQYPPVITPLDINVNSYRDDYPGGVIGKVVANDQDQYDILTFSLAPTIGVNYPAHELFQIYQTDGTLVALPRLDVGDYRINVTVTDGKFTAHTIVKVSVEMVTEAMVENAVAVRFRHVTPQSFILSHKKGFVKTVQNTMNCHAKDVIIVSVQPSSEDILQDFRLKRDLFQRDLDVLFAVRKSTDEFYTPDAIRRALNGKIDELEENTKLVVEDIAAMKCTNSFCVHGVCQDRYILHENDIEPVATDVVSFVSPKHHKKIECLCKEGYGGEKCDAIVNECAREPCPVYKICFPDASLEGYTCQCPEGFAGNSCEVDISKCHDETCYVARNPISFTGKSYSQYRIINKKLIEEELSLSLRVRTTQLTGNLMYAAGIIDYNILEIMNGVVQYRFDLGSGEGIVRLTTPYISDGKWHEIHLERDRNTAKITVDGDYVAQGSAPGINDVLNLQNDEMYLGAEVHQHPSILGFEDVQRGFYGCMDDVRISRVSIPLHESGDNSIAVLKRFANVKFSCDSSTMLIEPGPCTSQPCLNGGTCRETATGFECKCHSRFAGVLCELDTDPCASAPCLHGGACLAEMGGDFTCDCASRLTGKRCEYGKYCMPNPCKHGGVCEEGNDGPLCKCRGFAGEFCQFDVDECESSPCHNGGVCHNEIGSFKCLCPPNTTGVYCNLLTRSESILASIYNIKLEFLIYIGVAAFVLLILIITLVVCVVKLTGKRSQRHQNVINNETRKEHHNNKPNDVTEVKRGSKLSNLEVNQRDVPICLPRPLSYTPSSQMDSPYVCNNTILLNNLDTLRSYGSAGDELEVPADYVRNLNSQQNSIGNHTELKTTWAEQMQLTNSYDKQKIKNDLKLSSGATNSDVTRLYGGKSNTVPVISKFNGYPAVTSTSSEEDQRSVGSYHWDCSDWARHSQTLPNITEVPGSEVPDSSSFHSNESNESQSHLHQCHYLPGSHPNQKQPRSRDPLNEDLESEECMADSELDARAASPNLNALNSCNEEFQFTSGSFVRHPNSYLPIHGYNIPSETEGDCLNSLSPDSDDVEPYGFPSSRVRRPIRDDETESVITTLAEERHSLLGGYPSNSDLSANLCELEDSECESEQKPLNYLPLHQTSV